MEKMIPQCMYVNRHVANVGITTTKICPGETLKTEKDEFGEVFLGACESYPNCTRLEGKTTRCKEMETWELPEIKLVT